MIKSIHLAHFSIFKNLKSKSFIPIGLGLLSGFAVFYFLYFFGAYGIQKGTSYSGHSHLFRSLSFGLLTFVYLSLFELWLKPKRVESKFIYALIWYLGLVILGSHLIFILFNFFWNWQEWTMQAYLLIMKEFPLMMVLPIFFYLVVKTKFQTENADKDYLLFQSENGKDRLKIRSKDFMYANSSENYISIFYTTEEKTQEHLIRKPLKVLESELKEVPDIVRSHRSFLVNKRNIQATKQIKGKVQIEINGTAIPVSKQLQSQFLS